MDLVEISPHADPPVCKILDSGKLKYKEQKKRTEARKKRKRKQARRDRRKGRNDRDSLEQLLGIPGSSLIVELCRRHVGLEKWQLWVRGVHRGKGI